jgi:chemotaxis-related protein WspD
MSAERFQIGSGSGKEPVSISDGIDICWQRIGIFGDATCPELPKVVHCRNCPVYALAAQRLLDRPAPADYRLERTAQFAALEKSGAPARASAVLFRIGNEWLAFPTEAFQEVAERRRVHSLPHKRDGFIRGLVNIRGELLICISLERLLGIAEGWMDAQSQTGGDRLLAIAWDGNRFVFPVSEVHGVERFHLEDLRSAPAALARSSANHTRGIFTWRGNSVGLLNPAAVFASCHRSLS